MTSMETRPFGRGPKLIPQHTVEPNLDIADQRPHDLDYWHADKQSIQTSWRTQRYVKIFADQIEPRYIVDIHSWHSAQVHQWHFRHTHLHDSPVLVDGYAGKVLL